MRHVCALAMVAASVSLSGCVNSSFDSLTSLQTGCGAGSTSVTCSSPTPIVTPVVTPVSPSGQPTVNTGNTSTVPVGDTTVIVESSVNATTPNLPAVSILGTSPLNVAAGNVSNQQIWFNTNTANNAFWPISKALSYSDYGTCVNDGGVGATAGLCVGGTGGHGLGGNYKLYRSYIPNKYDEELQVWTWNNSYATQYRDVTASGVDPQHQAWSFGGNYTTAAAMPTSGLVTYAGQWTATAKTANFDPSTKTVTAPLLDANGNQVVINGTPQTTTLAQTVSPSNNWQVSGKSALSADFGAGTLNGRLSSTGWIGIDKNNGFQNVDPVAAVANNAACVAQTGVCNTNTLAGQAEWINWINYRAVFMGADVVLAGKITTSTTNTAKPNQVAGTAVMDPNMSWVTDATTNPLYAGFFGPVVGGKPQEVTGNFAFRATTPYPNAGTSGINNDRRGTIEMSGIFNGQ